MAMEVEAAMEIRVEDVIMHMMDLSVLHLSNIPL
jgi:hypothetical protein